MQADTNNHNTEHLHRVLPLPVAVKQEPHVPAGLLAGERGIAAPDLTAQWKTPKQQTLPAIRHQAATRNKWTESKMKAETSEADSGLQ